MTFAALLSRAGDLPVEAQASVSTPCDIRIVSDRSAFQALEHDWTELFERAGRPEQLFQSFNWLWHWTNHFLDGSTELALITGWQSGRLVMVWPLARTRSAGVRVLRWMGEPASQYGDVLVEPGPFAAALLRQGVDQLCSMGADVALLRKVRRDSCVAGLLAGNGLAVASLEAPRLDFQAAPTFEAVTARFAPKHRSTSRRLARRLDETGGITFMDDVSGADAAPLVRQALALKVASLAHHGRFSAALEQPATQAFFHDAMTSVERPVGAMVNAILRDGQPVGIALSLVCKGEAFGHVLAHDVACEKQGVGIILAERAFRTAHGRGTRGFDMLAPADEFKFRWSSSVSRLDDWALPLTRRGTVFVRIWAGQIRPRLKALADTGPAWLGSIWWLYRRLRTRHRP